MEKYLPDVYQKSIYTINYQKLKENGIKCILLDLDNTMIPAKSNIVTEKLEQLIAQLKKDFKIIIFSNAIKKRVKPVAEKLELDYYAFALKPMQKYYLKSLKEYRFKECEVAIIGDQIQTDILGGNRVGITTILVNPVSTKDFSFTRLNRYLEKRKMEKMCLALINKCLEGNIRAFEIIRDTVDGKPKPTDEISELRNIEIIIGDDFDEKY